LDSLAPNLRVLSDESGQPVGRVAVAPNFRRADIRSLGVVTVGGLRSNELSGIAGVLVGRSVKASRDLAVPLVSTSEIARWAAGQELLVAATIADPEALSECAGTIWFCGATPKSLPVAQDRTGWVSVSDIQKWKPFPPEVILFQDIVYLRRREVGNIKLRPNTLAIDAGFRVLLGSAFESEFVFWPRTFTDRGWGFHNLSLKGLVMSCLAELWSAEPQDVIEASTFSDDENELIAVVGSLNGKNFKVDVDVVRNPKKRPSAGRVVSQGRSSD